MTAPDPDAPVVYIADEPDEEDDVSPDALVAYGTSLLKDPAPASPEERQWLLDAANRLDQSFREALHGAGGSVDVPRNERKSRP